VFQRKEDADWRNVREVKKLADPNNNNNLLQTRGPYHRRNRTTQARAQKCLAMTHYRICVCTRPTLMAAKHFNNAAIVASFTHDNAGIQ